MEKRIAIVLLALTLSGCATLGKVISGESVTIKDAVQDVGDIAAVACAAQTPEQQEKIRGVVTILNSMVKAGNVDQAKALLEMQMVSMAGKQFQSLAWLALHRGLARLDKPEWQDAYSSAVASAVTGCAMAIGVGTA